MIKVYNQNMELAAILQNAFGIGYEMRLNEIWAASFSMPADDPKNEYCQPFYFCELFDGPERIELFRIVPTETTRTTNGQYIVYQLEHVLATLMDDVLFKYHEQVNLSTTTVLNYILGQQTNARWELGQNDFNYLYSYKWENDNLLSALLSVPKPFIDEWQITFDTTTTPWQLNFIAPDTTPTTYIRYRKNLKGIKKQEDPTEICTRLYILGYGEGVNQLGIESINPTGQPYIEDAEAVSKYGVISRVWVDRRYEHAQTLYDAGQAMLNQLKTPFVSYEVEGADLYRVTNDAVDKFKVGAYVRAIDDELGIDITTKVTTLRKDDVEGAPGDIGIEIANKSKDIGGTVADLADRQRIHEVYAQGATNLDSHDYNDNCDEANPATIKFYLPAETVRINKMMLTYQTEAFRAYSKATKGGGATTVTSAGGGSTTESTTNGGGTTETTTSGGGTTATSSSGGGVNTSTANGGSTTETTTSGGSTTETTTGGGSHSHTMFYAGGFEDEPPSFPHYRYYAKVGGMDTNVALPAAGGPTLETYSSEGYHSHSVSIPSHTHSVSIPDHSHSFEVPNHTHDVTIPNHSHDVTIPEHNHSVTIPDHTHQITLPDHTHEIDYGIYKGNTPTAVTVAVDGNPISGLGTDEQNVDIIPFLSKDAGGRIKRDAWHEITITPNGMGRIVANVVTQLFVQSRGGGDY